MVYNYIELPTGTKDEGGKIISLNGITEFPAGIEEKLSEEVNDFVRDIADRSRKVMMVGGRTSSGLLYVGNDVDVGKGIEGISMKRVETPVMLSKYIEVEKLDGKPVSVTIPASATVKAVNEYLKANFGPKYRVDYDITTSSTSHLGANFLTGGLGDNREALDVIEITLVNGNGKPEVIRDPVLIDALRGTQGYAGTVTKLKLRVIEDFPNEEIWTVPLIGKGPKVYGDSYARLLANIWEYMHYRSYDGMRIIGSEILHRSGADTVKRVIEDEVLHQYPRLADKHDLLEIECRKTALFREAGAFNLALGSDSDGAVLIRVRHGFDEPLLSRVDHPFIERLVELNEGRYVGEPTPVSSLEGGGEERIGKIDNLRASVPEHARKEGARAGNYSQSMDVDVVIKIPKGANPDDLRPAIERAHLATSIPFERADEIAEEQGIIRVENGHELAVERERREGRVLNEYFDGGRNRHKRLTADEAKAHMIKSLCKQTGAELRRLHGRDFGNGVIASVEEGEKKYSTDSDALQHFVETQPVLAQARGRAIAKAGEAYSFRTPKATQKTVMRLVGEIAAK